jgi:hypothetical protein
MVWEWVNSHEGLNMYRKLAITILALSVGAGLVLALPASSAQAQQQPQKKAQGQSRPAGNAGASRGAARTGGPSAGRAAIQSRARTVTQSSPRNVTQSRARTVTQGSARTITQSRVRTVTQGRSRTVTQGSARSVTRRGARTVTKQVVAPAAAAKVVAPSGANAHVVTASRLRGAPARGAGRTSIRGQNFSAWRRGYRVRHGNGWSTFVALSALSAIAIGSNNYYPYAYISAPQDYCDGLTEDGCQLMWQQVQTDEGDLVYQCVAYCPWQQ